MLHDLVYLFESYVRIDANIEWAQDNSMPVIAYKKSSRSASEFMDLAKELDTRAKK